MREIFPNDTFVGRMSEMNKMCLYYCTNWIGIAAPLRRRGERKSARECESDTRTLQMMHV